MAPPWVIERLDIIEDGKLCLAAAGENDLVQVSIGLERAPERYFLCAAGGVAGIVSVFG